MTLLLLGLIAALSGGEAKRRSVLVLLADDQRRDAFHDAGNPDLRTPRLDRLRARSFRFERAYCMGSIHGAVCQPSRAMLLTGRTLYRVPMDLAAVPTVPEQLRAAGVRTFFTGKWHNGEESFQRSFEEARSVFLGGMHDHFSVPVRDLTNGELGPVRTAAKFSSEEFADAAVEFLEAQDGSVPFLCWVSFTAPHDPRTPPPGIRDGRPLPALPVDFLPQHPFDNGWMTGRDETLLPWPRPPELLREQIGEYLGLVEHLDGQVGRILDTLDARGLTESTLVVYTSDHGLALGSHGLLGKQNLYEPSMGSPLFLAGPQVPVGSSDALVYLHDLAPTILRFFGQEVPAGVEGEDLAGQWSSPQAPHRESLFLTYENSQRAIVTSRHKLIRYPLVDVTQLFDLEADPHELHDLAQDGDHEAEVAALLRDLEAWQSRVGDRAPLVVTEPRPRFLDLTGRPRKADAHQPEWVVRKYFGDGRPPED